MFFAQLLLIKITDWNHPLWRLMSTYGATHS